MKINYPGITRRTLLQRTIYGLGATAFRIPFAIANEPDSSVMDKLCMYMSEARDRALPDEVIERTKLHVLDTFAAMISGSQLLPGRAAIKFAREYGGEKVATVAASDLVCGPIEAAMTNGMLAHSDETDDVHSPSRSHPGSSAIPSALAVGEKWGIDGTHFLRAVALGYDIGTRVVMTAKAPALVATHKSPFSFAGVFVAAAAAGSAASLTAQQMRWLLDYSAQQCSGILAWQRDTDHIEKGFVFTGMPVRSGVTAALVVQSGWTGVDDIFSGADNFLAAYTPEADPAGLVDKLGERFEIMRTDYKKWSVGMPIQAPLDALEQLIKKCDFQAAQVQHVNVRLGSAQSVIVDNRDMPDICLQHLVALMLIDKAVTFRTAHDKPRMKDPEILRTRAKVQVIPDEALERLLPRREATVEVTLADGRSCSQTAEARGTMTNPMSRGDVIAKASDLISPVLGSANCKALIERVLSLESSKDIRELRPLLHLTAHAT